MKFIRRALTLLHLLIGVAAVWAGQAFVRHPDGSDLGIPVDWLEGSPFPDYRFPGAFLAVAVGGANLLSAVALWRGHRLASPASLATGLLLVAWVAIQTGIIGFRHWSQAIWWTLFPVVTLLAALIWNREARTARK